MVRQAQAREKLLQKKLEAGLTEMPEQDPEYDWSFPDAGELPVPVLSIENVSFNYPKGPELYSKVDFGVDLQTRVALGKYYSITGLNEMMDEYLWRIF